MALTLSSVATTAHAAPPSTEARASQLFQKGSADYARGDFRAAAASFEAAHQTAPAPATIYNAALAWLETGERARAADDLALALEFPDIAAAQRADAERRLRELESVLGVLRVDARAGRVSVGHAKGRSPPFAIHLKPGLHRVVLELPDGRVFAREVTLGAAMREDLSFTDLPEPERAPNPPPGPPAAAKAETGSQPARVWGWAALGGAALASGTAVYLGRSALEARDDYDRSDHTDAEARDRAASLRLWTNVAWGTALLGGAAGVYLLLSNPSQKTQAAIGVGPRGVTAIGRF